MKSHQQLSGLPGSAYTDPEMFQSELSKIFGTTWQYVCHREDVRNPGDFVELNIGKESIFVMCGDDNQVRGFFNVCAHRASRLVEGKGCIPRISCPYHGWTYDTAGQLLAAPNGHRVPGFDKSEHRLSEFKVEVMNGLVFANLDGGAPSLSRFAPGLEENLKACSPDLPDLTFVHRTEAYLKGNWKVAIENFSECYHCRLLHPDLVTGIVELESYRVRVNDNWHKHESEAKEGESPVYDYGDAECVDSIEFAALWMWPNFAFQNYPGGAVHVWKWHPIDVSNTHVTVDWYFRSNDLQDWETQLIEHHARKTFAEDIPIIERVQLGLSSEHWSPGPLMIDTGLSQFSEHGVLDIQTRWRAAMESQV